MASLQLMSLFTLLLMIPTQVICSKDAEDGAFRGINSYRRSLNLPTFSKNDNAVCIADELADKLEQKPCSAASSPGPRAIPGADTQLSNYPDALKKCGVQGNTTRDAVALQACIPDLKPNLVVGNLTRSPAYARYLNDSKYTGVGIGSEDDWIVVVLSTNTPAGSFEKGGGARVAVGLSCVLVALSVAAWSLLLPSLALSLFLPPMN